MFKFAYFILFVLGLVALSACGGGGGGSSVTPPSGGNSGGATPTPLPSVSGDMLALTAGRGWNYQTQGTSASGPLTVSLYDNVSQVNGNTSVLVAVAALGLVPTALTDPNTAEANAVGALGLVQSSAGYNINSYISAGSRGTVPGDPLFIASTLTLHEAFAPYPGVNETVTAIGTMPNAAACPAPTAGATVQYVYSGQTYTISFVPGCGMTQVIQPNNVAFNLISIGNYGSTIGNLSEARRVQSATLLDTGKSLLGLNRMDMPMASKVESLMH
jgi:hypothetical protein